MSAVSGTMEREGVVRATGIEVDIARSLAEMDAVASEWTALEAISPDRMAYFQSFAWCRAWVARFARSGTNFAPYVVMARRGRRLVGVLPLMIERPPLGVRTMRALGEPHSQYASMLCDGCDPLVAEAMLSAVQKDAAADVVVFNALPESSALAAVLPTSHRVPGYENESSILDLSAYGSSEAYTESLGKTQKRNRNRRRNHLARLGELAFEMVWPSDSRFAGLVDRAVAFKRRWLKETGRVSIGFGFSEYERFLADLSGDAASREGACLSVLTAGETVVAIELGFIRQGHYYAYIGGFDWDLRDLSPGKVQMEMTVCWLIDNGVDAYDLLGNAADYKQSWSNRSERLLGYAIPFSAPGRFYAGAWLPTIRPQLKRAVGILPHAANRLASLGQGSTCLLLLYV